MKKMFMMCCAVAAAVCAQGATIKTVRGLAAGDVGDVPSGKIVAAEVVSEVSDGTVALSRVTEANVFTNAYSVSVSTTHVMTVSSVTTNRFFDHVTNGIAVGTYVESADGSFAAQSSATTNRYFDLVKDGLRQRVFLDQSTNATRNGSFHYPDNLLFASGDGWKITYERDATTQDIWWRLISPDGATNAATLAEHGIGYNAHELDFGTFGHAVERVEIVPEYSLSGGMLLYERDAATYVWQWVLRDGSSNIVAKVDAERGVGYTAHQINFGPEVGLMNERFSYINSYATNDVVSVSTNSVTPVLKARVSVTNAIASGTCSNGYWRASPESAWTFKGDRIIFTGTATGGCLRLVVE